jgi:hypothetical protein
MIPRRWIMNKIAFARKKGFYLVIMIVTVLLLPSSVVFAKWTSVTPPDVSSGWGLNGVHFTSSSEGWAVGTDNSNGRGVLLHYSNDTWASVTPPDVSSNWALYCVHFTSPNDGWAVGVGHYYDLYYWGVLLHYSDGIWTSVYPPDMGSYWGLSGVYFTSPNDGWALGRGWDDYSDTWGVLLHYSDGAWTSGTFPDVGSDCWGLDGVHFTSPNDGWAVGWDDSNERGVLLHYSDGTWTLVTSPHVSSVWWLDSVYFTSPNDGWAVGGRYNVKNTRGVLLHYSNASWTSVTPPDVSSSWTLSGVHFTSFIDGWAVGYTIGYEGLIRRGVLLRYSEPPPAPTGISASDGTYMDKVEVTWSASLRAESYKVYRSTSSDTGVTKTLLGTTTDTFFDDTRAVPMKKYFYWVKALNTIGTSKFSAYDKGYRSDGSPLVPTNVSASDGTYVDRVEVTWSASLRAESYKVYRARSKDPGVTRKLLGTTIETIFNDTTAISGRKYYYWVKASNTIGTSKFSACDQGYR